MIGDPNNEDTVLDDTPLEDDEEGAAHEPEQQDGDPAADDGEAPEEDLHIDFGDGEQEVDDKDPTLPKHLRTVIKDRDKELAALRRENEQLRAGKPKPEKIVVGPRPKIEDADWDQDKYDQMLDQWEESRTLASQQEAEEQRHTETAQKEWDGVLQSYAQKRTELRRPDFADAEKAFAEAIDPVMQNAVLSSLDNPAAFVYALGRSPERLAVLSAAQGNPAKFLVKAAKMEAMMKVTTTPRKKPPAPEQIARGSASLSSGAADKRLEEMERRAEKTGDRTDLIRYKRELRENGK